MIRSSQVDSATFTRPSNTTAYASGDLVANNTTAGSVTLLSWKLPEGGVWLRQLRLTSSNTTITNGSFRVWFTTDSAVTFTNGDNGALAVSSGLALADVIGFVDVTLDGAIGSLGSVGTATFDPGLLALFAASYANGRGTVYGFVEARAAYTPASAEVFTIYLRGEPI